MASSTDQGIKYPTAGDWASLADIAAGFKTVADSVNVPVAELRQGLTEGLDAVKFSQGVLPNGTDINAVRDPGVYSVPTTTAAATMVNWPTSRAGTLVVGTNTGAAITTQQVIARVSDTAPIEQYARATSSTANTSWSPWATPEWVKPTALSGTINVDTYRVNGTWAIPSTTGVTGLPTTRGGILEVVTFTNTGMAMQRYTARESSGASTIYRRMTLLVAGWAGIAWEQVGGSSGTSGSARTADVQVSDHATRVEVARSRRGGGTGTAGLPVVMLRFDHWLDTFKSKVLPILRQYNLPATLNMNYENLSLAQNGAGSIPWSEVQSWNQYDGIEIANHGATHNDQTTAATIYNEIVNGRRNLEAAMPYVAVETWQEHGSSYFTAGDITGDVGLQLGRDLNNFTESYAGRLIMAEHAVVEGKIGGFYHPLSGHPQVGQSHISIDLDTQAEAIARVTLAQTLGLGTTVYIHPGLLDSGGGYMTTAIFTALCAHIAAERDAGRLMVMTAAGGAFADSSHGRRRNLLVKADFTTGYGDWWAGTSGYTFTNPGQNVVITTSGSATPMSQSMLMHSRFGWAMGAAHELLVWARSSSATTLTLGMEKLGDPAAWKTEKVHQVPGDNVLRPYRLNLTLPRDKAITQMTTRLGGPNLTIERPPLLAAI